MRCTPDANGGVMSQEIKLQNKNEKIREGRKRDWTTAIFLAVLVLYPLRHIRWGLDLWDVGYSYANFEYMGLEHMDSMWLFSTYLANALGHFFTWLPFGKTLIGMNFYTGLLVSFLGVAGYLFCTKSLKFPGWITFLGEMLAVSLCWCPTATMYNYLTYVFFLVSFLFLYNGLVKNKRKYLFVAGLALGANVLVRFSNLPQAAMIVAVWAYGVVEYLDNRTRYCSDKKTENAGQSGGKGDMEGAGFQKVSAWKVGLQRTLWCLAGYLASLVVLFGYIHIRYGIQNYISGILRLFSMTDEATDYKATSMLFKMFYSYVENLYWLVRFAVIIAVGILVYGVTRLVLTRIKSLRESERCQKICAILLAAGWICVCVAAVVWLYMRGFCSFAFYSYDAMLRPATIFLMITMLIGVIRIFHKDSAKEEKLISGMVILVILLTAIGSNNGVYPSINNLFVAAPYSLWEIWKFLGTADIRWKKMTIALFPVKGFLCAFLALVYFQSMMFGVYFSFAEGTGVQNISATVDNNPVLKGVKMSPERAQWMESISRYVQENHLEGEEVILYGMIPSLSFYLQMPSAFNPWSDLASYDIEVMKQEMEKAADTQPVVILEHTYSAYLEGGEVLDALELSEQKLQTLARDEKFAMICSFLEQQGYYKAFENEKFTIWAVGGAGGDV